MSSPRAGLGSQLAPVQDLYDRNLFLDAYRLSGEYWTPTTRVEGLSTDELVLGARLAVRLGGFRLSRHLLRTALRKDPTSPRVRYFAQELERTSLFDKLRAFETQPDLGGDDVDLRSSWFSSHALLWARLRDFERAHEFIARARALSPDSSFVLGCESRVYAFEDRWPEALRSAEVAWELNPGAPYTADALGASLLNLGRIRESSSRLAEAAESSQSHQVVCIACWHLCAVSEVLSGESHRAVLRRASELADRLETLCPLADREARILFARVRLDIADAGEDHAAMERWSTELRSPFHRRLLENLRKNPPGARIRLPFRRTIQKYDACLPTSVVSALAAMGVSMDADAMTAEITFGGTPIWASAEWLEKHGVTVRHFRVTPGLAADLIRQGIAFVILLEGDDSGHAVAAVGLDEAAGTLLVHDPRSFRAAEYLLEFAECDAPFGPGAMAAVPAEKATLLDQLLPEDAQVAAATRAHERTIGLEGPTAARSILSALEKRFPKHPGTRLLQVVQAESEGRTGAALQGARQLLEEFPGSRVVRVHLVAACRALGNSALLRETLESILRTGALPGMQAQEDWIYLPARYVCEYADLERSSAETRKQARFLLLSVLGRQVDSAGAWHVLADLLMQELDAEGALLCYRLASCLASNNEHYARAYSNALAALARPEDGFAWLQMRTRVFGGSPRGSPTWVTWISALEDGGYPERALAACAEALERHGDSPELLAFVVPFLGRMGHWGEAEQLLHSLGACPDTATYHEAAHHFCLMRGDLAAAGRHGEQWLRERPGSMPARYALLELTAHRDGPLAALQQAAGWKGQHPGHEDLEVAYLRQLDRAPGGSWKRYSVLLRRLKRNPEDAWAWLEAAFIAMTEYHPAGEGLRRRLESRITEFLRQCDRTAPLDPATLRAHARWHEVRGEWQEALETWLHAIDSEPDNFYSYDRAWECAARFDRRQCEQVWERMEPNLRKVPGRLTIARSIMGLLATRFGDNAAEKAMTQWRLDRPDDPDVLEAAIDLLLEHGHGRSDAERALAILEPAVDRFPYHLGLRFSLAHGHRALGQHAEAETVLREIIRRHPGNSGALIQLARVHQLNGNMSEAEQLLEAARACDPRNGAIWEARCRGLIRAGRPGDAAAVVQEGLELMPEDVGWRERAIELLLECVDEEASVAAAREGTRIHPKGAYLWLLLGRTLQRSPRFAAQGEIEACIRRSLNLNASLFESADWLAMLLVDQRRYSEAEEVMQSILPRISNSCHVYGRLAWIKRHQGFKQEAVDDLATTLSRTPWYSWGWVVLMEWLGEDLAWERARELLGCIRPELRTDTGFRLQRLMLLEKAGLAAGELDAEWEQLLQDFPENVSLHLERHDVLLVHQRHGEAAAVLRGVLPIDPESPYLLARMTAVLLQEQQQEEALDTALRVWFGPGGASAWCPQYAWQAFDGAGLGERLYEAALVRLQQGMRPAPHVLNILAEYVVERNPVKQRSRQPRWRYWFPHKAVRELLRLLTLVEAFPEGRATLLSSLTNHGYCRFTVRFWKAHRPSVEGDVEVWAEVGRALVMLGQKKVARDLLSSWRDRPGVQMCMVANYVVTLPQQGRDNQQETAEASGDALAKLPHDHTAKFLAHIRAEACARLDDTVKFLETWNSYRCYFTGEVEESEFFPRSRRGLLESIPGMAQALERKDLDRFDELLSDLARSPWSRAISPQQGKSSNFEWVWILFAFIFLMNLLGRCTRP